MRIRMTTFLIWHGQQVMPGEEVDLPDDVARRYLATNQAESIQQREPATTVVEAAAINRQIPNAAIDRRPQQFRRR